MKNELLLNALNKTLVEKVAVWGRTYKKEKAPVINAEVYSEGLRKGYPVIDAFGNKLGTKNYITPENTYIENFARTFENIANKQRVEDGGAYAKFVIDPERFKGLAARMSNGEYTPYDEYLVQNGMQAVYDGTPADSQLGASAYDTARVISQADGTIRNEVSNVPLSAFMGGNSTANVNTAAGYRKLVEKMKQDMAASSSNGDYVVYTSRKKLPNNTYEYDANLERAKWIRAHNQRTAQRQMARKRTWKEYLFNGGQKYNIGAGAREYKGLDAWNPFSRGVELKYIRPNADQMKQRYNDRHNG